MKPQPLSHEADVYSNKRAKRLTRGATWVDKQNVSEQDDAMTYHIVTLATWTAFYSGMKTIWSRKHIWKIMAQLACISLIVAALSAYLLPNPEALIVSKFSDISNFLRVFVGLLLGFFLTSSMNRWYTCCTGFLELFDAIRNMQMQFIALGAMKDRAEICIRYGVLSAHLLNMELHAEALHGEERVQRWEEMWGKIAQPPGTPRDDHVTKCGTCFDGEIEVLRLVDDPASLVWIWVASLVGRMAQDGDIPGMPTPTYGRIMNLVQAAHGGIRRVRGSISVQAPYIYVHMLATLVHINNILNAISFGFIAGTSIGVYLASRDMHPGRNVPATTNDSERDFQDVVVGFFFCVFGPLLYQALLEVSLIVARPFANEEACIPLQKLLAKLAVDLEDGLMMAANPCGWEKPSFKAPV